MAERLRFRLAVLRVFPYGGRLLVPALVVQVLSGLMPTYWAYAAVLPLIGISVLTTATTANAVIQLTTIPEMRGRVVSLYLMVFVGSTPFGAPVIGWIGEHVGAREALVASGLIAGLGISVATLLYARRHDLDTPELSPLVRRMLRRQRFDQQVLARAD